MAAKAAIDLAVEHGVLIGTIRHLITSMIAVALDLLYGDTNAALPS